MGGLGVQELVVILIIALLFVGGKKLPEVASAMGKAVREFKRGMSDTDPADTAPKAIPSQSGPDQGPEAGMHT
jgi:TatA/E family protein of Tat protein translocase